MSWKGAGGIWNTQALRLRFGSADRQTASSSSVHAKAKRFGCQGETCSLSDAPGMNEHGHCCCCSARSGERSRGKCTGRIREVGWVSVYTTPVPRAHPSLVHTDVRVGSKPKQARLTNQPTKPLTTHHTSHPPNSTSPVTKQGDGDDDDKRRQTTTTCAQSTPSRPSHLALRKGGKMARPRGVPGIQATCNEGFISAHLRHNHSH